MTLNDILNEQRIYAMINDVPILRESEVHLFEELIVDNTNENEIVFDPFMGSGTTAIACLNTDRQYIGFELDER